eukprot:CAMPEP_0172534244 /NCGR_PEP_ID=MMETSP1067-20121228/6687_1 /TAXON_ID=265564 ORGANISM="Thalassiosira punctigera, Strain Tpunct2005C2" /NCGR_SAMPLE_ID=MMETSP1067 /ASSEMBLY_ACC=CAM_ASM_000444 /LENGTH=124 /DNA_ID=CAMNT_0013319017 /DNA_START=389 /DNA_END=763 /DNA_ORIENTATION=-
MAYLAAATSKNDTTGGSGTDNSTSREVTFKGNEAIRGMEHLLCPEVAEHLVRRRRMATFLVLEEQQRIRIDDYIRASVNDRATMHDNDKDDLHRAARIARVAMATSLFSKEWTRRITNLHKKTA